MKARTYLLAIVMTVVACNAMQAQSLKDRLKKKAKDRMEQSTNGKTDAAMDTTLNRAEHVIRCVIGDDACVKAAEAKGSKVEMVPPAATPAPAPAPAPAPGTPATAEVAKTSTVFVNYDFIPG